MLPLTVAVDGFEAVALGVFGKMRRNRARHSLVDRLLQPGVGSPAVVRHGVRVALMVCVTCLALAAAARADSNELVNPFVGTDTNLPVGDTGGSAGATFPGAVAPHGMIQWSPDSIPSTTNFAGGYTYRDERLRGFSLTHLSGGDARRSRTSRSCRRRPRS
jgi:putative alpha-1,2-mannosidase